VDVVDQHVETALLRVHALEEPAHLFADGVIHLHGDADTAARGDHLRRLVRRLRAALGGRLAANTAAGAVHRRSGLPQHACDAAPGAPRGAGDDRDLSCQRLHDLPSLHRLAILNGDAETILNESLETVKREMSPRPRKASDEEVFAAAHRAMSRLGPAQLTLSEIAVEAGVTAGALVQRFGSKHRLLLAMMSEMSGWSRDFFAQLRAAHGSPLAALYAYADCFAQMGETPARLAHHLSYLQLDLTDPDFY